MNEERRLPCPVARSRERDPFREASSGAKTPATFEPAEKRAYEPLIFFRPCEKRVDRKRIVGLKRRCGAIFVHQELCPALGTQNVDRRPHAFAVCAGAEPPQQYVDTAAPRKPALDGARIGCPVFVGGKSLFVFRRVESRHDEGDRKSRAGYSLWYGRFFQIANAR